jgi:IMP dehydrogenase
MKKYNNEEQLSFDDILLVPQHSEITSRSSVDLSVLIGSGNTAIRLAIPFVAAPMDTVCEWEMAVAMRNAGGIGIIHRYLTIEERSRMVRMIVANNSIAAASVGATGLYLAEAAKLASDGASLILVDIANGHSQFAVDAVKNLRKLLGNTVHIMAGNVATYDGFAALSDAGADSIRVGIGGGSACTTRIVSGHGIPTLASIIDIRNKISKGSGASLIADGGIRYPGDAAKAMAAGADAIMLGGLLAGTEESPGTVDENGYKVFRGMASKEAQEEGRGSVSGVEGIATRVPFKGSVTHVLMDLAAGLKSAYSYTGVDNAVDFYERSMYTRVTSLSLNESKPHAKKKEK